MTIRIETTGLPVEVLPGIGFPPGVAVIAEGEPHPCDVTVWVGVQNGRMVPIEVTVTQRPGGPTVTSDRLRSIKVATLVKYAAAVTVVSTHLDRSELARVAHMYRLAVFTGDAPTRTVADQLGKSRATAGRLIAAARKAGLL